MFPNFFLEFLKIPRHLADWKNKSFFPDIGVRALTVSINCLMILVEGEAEGELANRIIQTPFQLMLIGQLVFVSPSTSIIFVTKCKVNCLP